jgi:hypothetical protein
VFSKPDFLITVKVITHAEPHKVDERVKGNTGPNKLHFGPWPVPIFRYIRYLTRG